LNSVNTFWLTVTNVALGVAVLASMFVLAFSILEELWIRHRAVHLHARHLPGIRSHPHWFTLRHR
jgi:hypothetical protein